MHVMDFGFSNADICIYESKKLRQPSLVGHVFVSLVNITWQNLFETFSSYLKKHLLAI